MKFFCSYLAGLIEADGTIIVHDPNTKAKKYSPRIVIAFNKVDKPLASKLCEITKVGKVYDIKNAGYVLWKIQSHNNVLIILNFINGYMRTPKIEALHRAIIWFNNNLNLNLELKKKDDSPIDSNSWLAGFSDGDANFSINIYKRKNKSLRVQTFFRIELKQNYHRDSFVGKSFYPLLSIIAAFLNVNIYSRVRIQGDNIYYAYMVIAHNKFSHDKIRSYFNNFPLFSSKKLAFDDWCIVQNICNFNKNLTLNNFEQINKIKLNFNNKRTVFNWDHLEFLKIS